MKPRKNNELPLDKFINLSLYNKKFGYYMKKNFRISRTPTKPDNIHNNLW